MLSGLTKTELHDLDAFAVGLSENSSSTHPAGGAMLAVAFDQLPPGTLHDMFAVFAPVILLVASLNTNPEMLGAAALGGKTITLPILAGRACVAGSRKDTVAILPIGISSIISLIFVPDCSAATISGVTATNGPPFTLTSCVVITPASRSVVVLIVTFGAALIAGIDNALKLDGNDVSVPLKRT
jgi:hypothetical protein